MKKHSGGEKPGSKIKATKKVNLFFGLFFVFSVSVNSQILLNGFCKYNSYQIPAGLNFLAGNNLIEQPQNRLILFSPDKNEIGLQFTELSETVSSFLQIPFKYEISRLISFTGKTKKNRHVFTSRKKRALGIFEFTDYKTPELLSQIEFDSYPENLDVADIDLKGSYEFLVSGSGFNGISIITQQGTTLIESKVISEESYTLAGFADINNDEYPDIVAQNLYTNELQFFTNDGSGKFRIKKNISLNNSIISLKFADINNDGFTDIIFSDEISVTILYGDITSSYKKKKSIHTSFIPDEILLADFNNDRLTDIAYLNKTQGLIVLLFATKSNEFNEVVFCRQAELNDIAIFKLNGKKGIAGISTAGSLVTITALDSKDFSKNFSMVPSINPVALFYFNNEKTRYNNFCLIDEFDNSLKLFVNDEKGIPFDYYSVPLAEIHKKIFVDEFDKNIKYFYCYTPGERLFEVVKVNFVKKEIQRFPMYSPGEILDIFVKRKDNDFAFIYIAYNKSARCYLGRFEFKSLSITFKEYPFFDRNVLDAKILISDNPVVYYWKDIQDSVLLKSVEILTGPNKYTKLTGILKNPETVLNAFVTHTENLKWMDSFTFFSGIDTNYAILSDGNKKNFISSVERLNSKNRDKNDPDWQYIFHYHSGYLTVYIPSEKSFYKIEFGGMEHKFKLLSMLDAENAGDYFIELIDEKNLRIIFIDQSKGCISSYRVLNN